MSITSFRGAITPGDVQATFKSDYSNVDPDLLIVMFTSVGGATRRVEHGVAVPGGFCRVSLNTNSHGILEIQVATKQETDSGRLDVSLNGNEIDAASIQNAVRWLYSVQP